MENNVVDISRVKKALLIGVAGSNNAFSLSLYNLKAYAYSDAAVRKSWDIKIYQHPLINHLDYENKADEHKKSILNEKPDLVSFSCYMWNTQYFYILAKKIKTDSPDIKILFGGPEMTTDYIIEGKYDHFPVEFCISGEGEKTFTELLSHLSNRSPEFDSIKGLSYRKNIEESYIINEKRIIFKSLAEVTSPYLSGTVDDEVLFRPDVEANIETQRGCSLRCSYCIYHKDMKKIIYSGVERVVAETRFVINKGVKRIRYVDANFSSDLNYAKAVMQGMIENKFETRLMFELIPGFIDEELAALFNEFNELYEWNNITIGVGVQTINLEVLKRIRRAIKIDKFEKTFDLFQKYQIYTKIDLIIGLPGEDLNSIEKTLNYMLDKLQGSQSHLLCCHTMRGLPGTELMQIAQDYNMVFTSEFEPHELYESQTLSRPDMLKCLRRTGVIFRLVNHAGWARKEFIYDRGSESTRIHDAFYEARDRLGVTNIELIDLIIEGLMVQLKDTSYFIQERFPYAETWWWNLSKREIKDKWLLSFLSEVA